MSYSPHTASIFSILLFLLPSSVDSRLFTSNINHLTAQQGFPLSDIVSIKAGSYLRPIL